jgi:3-dehydroquinate synthase
MRKLTVNLAERSYEILVGSGLLENEALLARVLTQGRVAVVTNTTVAPLYLDQVKRMLRALDREIVTVVLPDGEHYKNWQTLNLIFDGLLGASCERETTLLALGGGVVGDMAGFAAACYQRGMPFVQLPTTLLSQVDSSVGGKTAINHPLGKNMIGAFYQPKLVLADIATLATLPERELSAGMAEVIKYGVIRDAEFFAWLESHVEGLMARDAALLEEAVLRSCRHKAEIVANDEREAGERALLNLGHTFGHAIEAGMGYGAWLHGEAVAVGMLMAAELSRLQGAMKQEEVVRLEALLERAGLPIRGPELAVARYVELMQHDKKVSKGKLHFVLPKAIGAATVTGDVLPQLVEQAIVARSPRRS